MNVKITYTGRKQMGSVVVEMDKPFETISLSDLKHHIPEGCSLLSYVNTKDSVTSVPEHIHRCEECFHEMLCIHNTQCPICGGNLR